MTSKGILDVEKVPFYLIGIVKSLEGLHRRLDELEAFRSKQEIKIDARRTRQELWQILLREYEAMSSTGEKKFQRCANATCQQTTEGFRADAKFCSDACRARHYREKKRRARQLASKGWPADRIAKELGRETKIVRGWIKRKQ
jgi:hypothetical protein